MITSNPPYGVEFVGRTRGRFQITSSENKVETKMYLLVKKCPKNINVLDINNKVIQTVEVVRNKITDPMEKILVTCIFKLSMLNQDFSTIKKESGLDGCKEVLMKRSLEIFEFTMWSPLSEIKYKDTIKFKHLFEMAQSLSMKFNNKFMTLCNNNYDRDMSFYRYQPLPPPISEVPSLMQQKSI